MRTLISFTALFVSIAFVQLGSGSLGPLDALAGTAKGFSTQDIGMLGSAHFVGFFIGCWLTPRLLGSVGHARAFAAFGAVGAISALLHPIVPDPIAWAGLRIGTGMAVAGAYTIAESWIQAKATNQNRGRVVGAYRVVDMTASVAAQGLVAVLDPTSYVAYNLIAVLCCLCLLPLTLTTSKAPPSPSAPRLRPLRVFQISPLSAVSVMVVGLTNSSFRMVGPIYALGAGLAPAEIGLFMAAGVGGGALAQWPSGWLSDKYDRRWVLIGISATSLLVCVAIATGGLGDAVYIASFAFGAAAFPLYSIATAHANDFAKPDEVVELNASLMFLYGVGAIVSPLLAALLIDKYGPPALFAYIAAAHVVLIVFSVWRMSRRPSATEKTNHAYVPRTSFVIGRIFRSRHK
ncbi:MAG: MFS transporter [Pikeienuella sp.]